MQRKAARGRACPNHKTTVSSSEPRRSLMMRISRARRVTAQRADDRARRLRRGGRRQASAEKLPQDEARRRRRPRRAQPAAVPAFASIMLGAASLKCTRDAAGADYDAALGARLESRLQVHRGPTRKSREVRWERRLFRRRLLSVLSRPRRWRMTAFAVHGYPRAARL